MKIIVDTTIARTMRAAGLEPAALVAAASRSGTSYHASDEHERILEANVESVFIDTIDGDIVIHGGSVDVRRAAATAPT